VNNAAVGLTGRMDELPAADQLDLVALNVRVPMALALAALPSMRAHGTGGVLNIGSIAGSFPGPNMGAYFASKAFIRSFLRGTMDRDARRRRERELPRLWTGKHCSLRPLRERHDVSVSHAAPCTR
jgi:NADP-dependent 3-hydroxy acid dehydrogenase YdfG